MGRLFTQNSDLYFDMHATAALLTPKRVSVCYSAQLKLLKIQSLGHQ
ncbi:hypothetical protein HMPREF1584_00760 [Gardnerella vaginalis JCP8481A]|uniref:Uncharacterized protein n=1 Tax=Gardnerella vaginalis TaxID=2702 RepID=A0A133NUS2_GARVA|nr:hypothetical protein HMPREF1585_00832 [Gardnerella vaginalis JCP8481B]EPI42896.1 hypothetical protein HMPREF1584_00760 [Gardnerella vaginalis JCP8481A]KXA20034.1 hypothetical protein HMPREF3208_00873 [Gardnerella vaginalis]